MYHSIIAARDRELFKRPGLQDYFLVLDGLAAQCEHNFYAVPALGGTPEQTIVRAVCRASCQKWSLR